MLVIHHTAVFDVFATTCWAHHDTWGSVNQRHSGKQRLEYCI